MRKCFCAVLALVIAVSCLCTSALAMGNESNGEEMIIARATGRFNMDVPANTSRKASTKQVLMGM